MKWRAMAYHKSIVKQFNKKEDNNCCGICGEAIKKYDYIVSAKWILRKPVKKVPYSATYHKHCFEEKIGWVY